MADLGDGADVCEHVEKSRDEAERGALSREWRAMKGYDEEGSRKTTRIQVTESRLELETRLRRASLTIARRS
jgi:hypothetical protein